MQKELKPCPYCGGENVTYNGAKESVVCECGTHGPSFWNKDKCIEGWNNLPRYLNWTTITPTKPDLYWNKSGNLLRIGEILEISGSLWCHFAGEKEPQLLELVGGEWAGPIPEPEERI